uniref:PDZ domain-containing protein n=1 Tax=Astyanax mexicanus TaxID=7994 RepID=A0A8B9HV95_ASTMX
MDMSGAGNGEISNNSEEQGQGKSPVAPMHSTAARFQIRSAKERQRISSIEPTKGLKTIHSRFDSGTGENVRRLSSIDTGKEVLRVRANSPQTPESDVPDRRTPRPLSQVSMAKNTELLSGSETSDATQEKKPDSVGNMTTKTRGRTEWRRANLSNRSKSLDWRGIEREKENQTVAIIDSTDFKILRRSESLQENGPGSSPKPNEPASPTNSVSLRIQAYNAIGQGKQSSSSATLSPVFSGSSSVRFSRVALALDRASSGQSLPSRLKRNESQDSTEGRKSPWWLSEQGSPKSSQAEAQLFSQVNESKVTEITGNKTIMDRIGKLYGFNASEENTDANSRDNIRAKRYSAPVGDWLYNSEAVDSNLSHWSPKKDGSDFTSTPDISSSVLPNKNNVRTDTTSPVSMWSREKPLEKDSTGLMAKSGCNVKTQLGEPVARLETYSLDRARSRNSPAALSRALRTQESSGSSSGSSTPEKTMQLIRQESIMKEVEKDRQVNRTTDNSTPVRVPETSPRKQVNDSPGIYSLGKEATGQPKSHFSRSVTVDSDRYKGNEDVFELGSSTLPRMKRLSFQEKGQVQSLDLVRNAIHKFETLAHQNQSPSQTIRTRRTFSVPEKTNLVFGVSKSNSDKSLNEWRGVWNTKNSFSKSNAKEDISRSSPDQKQLDKSAPVQSKELNITLYNIKDNIKTSVINRPVDAKDHSKDSPTNIKNIELTAETARPHLSVALPQNTSIKSNPSTDVSHPKPKDSVRSQSQRANLSDAKDEANLQIQEFPQGNSTTKSVKETTPVFPDSVPSFSSIKDSKTSSTANSTHPKLPSIPLVDSTVTTPAPSTLRDLNNICGTRDEKVAAKVSRWIANKGDGVHATVYDSDDDDELDDEEDTEGTERGDESDSGESSVTITSNTSQSDHRSFSLSFVDLCNLGGMDYPASHGKGSIDEEKWMSKRSASLSSDISVLSSVTLLATEELDCLLDDVRGLGDDALENCEDVQVVVLHKEVGRGLGFTVAGGVDQNKPVTVHRVFPYGAAGQEGSIQEGDQVLSINGTSLQNSAHWEALRTLRKARLRGMAVVVLRPGNTTENQFSTKGSPQKTVGNSGSKIRVTLTKSRYDLGFSLEGGVGSSLGDKPLTVQRIFQGGPVGKVLPGDELVEIQGQTLGGLRRLEAWNLIKRLPPGPVEVLLHRPHQPY